MKCWEEPGWVCGCVGGRDIAGRRALRFPLPLPSPRGGGEETAVAAKSAPSRTADLGKISMPVTFAMSDGSLGAPALSQVSNVLQRWLLAPNRTPPVC